MRYLRLFCATAALVCALAFSAYAGNIECPAITQPPPQETTDGNIECPAIQATLTIIQGVLLLS